MSKHYFSILLLTTLAQVLVKKYFLSETTIVNHDANYFSFMKQYCFLIEHWKENYAHENNFTSINFISLVA